MLLVCFNIHLKSILKYNFFLYDTCHPDHPYLVYMGKNVRIHGYFSKLLTLAREEKKLGNIFLCFLLLVQMQQRQEPRHIRGVKAIEKD